MKIRTKILLSYGIVFSLGLVVGGWSLLNLRHLSKTTEGIWQENYRSIIAAEKMIEAIERQDSATLLIMLGKEKEGTEQFHQHEITFLQWLGRAKDNITIPREEQLLSQLEEHYRDYLVTFSQLHKRQISQSQEPADYYSQKVLPSFKLVLSDSLELQQLNQQTMLSAIERTKALSQQAIWSMVVTGGAAAGLALLSGLILSIQLIRSLGEMADATKRIAEGDYDVAITVKSKDELGHLAQEITAMSRKLKAFHELNISQVIAEKKRSEAIIRSITDGIVVVNAEFKIVALNPTAGTILNTNSQQAENRHFVDVVKNRELYEHVKTTAETGNPPQLPENGSILALERDSQTEYYKFAIAPVTTEQGHMLGVVLLLQDVTKLKEIDRLKDEFIMKASHELRNPLTGMGMSIALLLETAQEKLSQREQELLQAAGEEVQRLRSLVNDLLDLSKIESGQIAMEFAPLEVKLLVEKALSLFILQAKEKQITLTEEVPTNLPLVKADPNKITWVLTNLIGNAMRYTDVGGQIQVSVRHGREQVYMSVTDNGVGIPFEYQGKIFDKFVQVKTDKNVGGTGLGLAICKEIVKAHGGAIWVDSTPGEGSTFTFTLPVIADRSAEKTGGEQDHAQC